MKRRRINSTPPMISDSRTGEKTTSRKIAIAPVTGKSGALALGATT